jgi:hypothetical protein
MRKIMVAVITLTFVVLTGCKAKEENLLEIVNGDIHNMIVGQQDNNIPLDSNLNIKKFMSSQKDTKIEILKVYKDDKNNREVIEFLKIKDDEDIKGYISVAYKGDKIVDIKVY